MEHEREVVVVGEKGNWGLDVGRSTIPKLVLPSGCLVSCKFVVRLTAISQTKIK